MKHPLRSFSKGLTMPAAALLVSLSLWGQSPGPPRAPSSWSVVATYSIPGKASGLAWDGTYLYFGIYGANGDDVYKFNPSTGTNSLLCSGPFDDAYGLTYKSPNLVTVSQPSGTTPPAFALEFSMAGSQVSTLNLPNHYMSGIAYDNGNYWVCTYYPDPGTVYNVNSAGTVISQFTPPANQPWDICKQGSDLWIADYNANTLYKVTTAGTVIESHASQIGKPSGIVYDGTYLWYCAGELGAASTLYKIDLAGSGTPVITVPVTSHNFGNVTVGNTSTWNCQVQNTGTANLVINSIQIVGGPVTTSFSMPATVTPGNSVMIPFVYGPTSPGALNADATINSNDPIHPSVVVTFTGNAVITGPNINISDTVHNWGERRKGAYSRRYLEVNNNGNQNLVLTGLTSSNPQFTVDASVTLPVSILPLQTVKIGLWYHPTQEGPAAGTLSIASNDPDQNPFIVHMEGTGIDTVYPIGTLLWTYVINGGFDNSPKGIRPIADITGDGVDDVVISSEDNFIRCLNGNSSVEADLMWETEIYSGNVYQENALGTIPDIDNDGYDDVIAGTTGGDRSVRALSGKTGAPLWRYDTHAFGDGGWVYQVDMKYDYNNNGKKDVLACAGDDGNNTGPRRVFCLDGSTGLPIWICPTEGAVFGVIGVEDFTGDGKPDVVAGATNVSQVQSRVYGINGVSGAIVWTKTTQGSSTWALIQVDDFTGDGIRDVATGDYSGNVFFHNAVNGNIEKTTLIQSFALILRFEDMGDVNKDGHPDFIVGHSGADGTMVNGYTGSILWQVPLSDKSWNVTNMGDITWDGYNDAAIGTLYQDNRAYFLNGFDGDILQMLPVNTPVDALDAIPDIVGDSSMELVLGGRSGGVACLSGGYDTTTTFIASHDPAPSASASVFPNPCGDRFSVGYRLQHPSDVTLRIASATGREVYTRQINNAAAGPHVAGFDRSTFAGETPPGIYVITVETRAGTHRLKAVFR